MSKNFYNFLNEQNKKAEKESEHNKPLAESRIDTLVKVNGDTAVQDETHIPPWTHKLIIYVNKPKKEFFEEVKGADGVVAVFVKEKGSSAAPKSAPPNN